MGVISKIIKAIAKPPAPETQAVRMADLEKQALIPGLGIPGNQLRATISRDAFVFGTSGEEMVPVGLFGDKALEDPQAFFGVDDIIGVQDIAQLRGRPSREEMVWLPALQTCRRPELAARVRSAPTVQAPQGEQFVRLKDLDPQDVPHLGPFTAFVDAGSLLQDGQRKLKTFDELSPLQKELLGPADLGRKRWASELTRREMECFLTLTSLWEHPELALAHAREKNWAQPELSPQALEGLRLTAEDFKGVRLSVVHTDRKHFELKMEGPKEAMARLAAVFGKGDDAKGAPTARGFLTDKPYAPFHPHEQVGGGRSPLPVYSLQFMIGEHGVAADVDMFQPLQLAHEAEGPAHAKSVLRHWALHWGEIIVGKLLLPDYMEPTRVAGTLDADIYSKLK